MGPPPMTDEEFFAQLKKIEAALQMIGSSKLRPGVCVREGPRGYVTPAIRLPEAARSTTPDEGKDRPDSERP